LEDKKKNGKLQRQIIKILYFSEIFSKMPPLYFKKYYTGDLYILEARRISLITALEA